MQDPTTRSGEAEFLSAYDASHFDRPSVAVDVALATCRGGRLEVLLARRQAHPFRGCYALPGGFVGVDESLDGAAARVLRTKTGLDGVFLEQLYTFGATDRDPRTRVVSVAYFALVAPETLERATLDRSEEFAMARVLVDWEGERGGPARFEDEDGRTIEAAFDHDVIVGTVVKRLRGRLDYSPIGFQLLPPTFTLRRLQEVHETVRGATVNKDSFRRRMLASGRLVATGELESSVGHRPAELYRFALESAV